MNGKLEYTNMNNELSTISDRINSANDELISNISKSSISPEECEERIHSLGRIVYEAYKDNGIDLFHDFSYPDYVVFLYNVYSHFHDYIKEYH